MASSDEVTELFDFSRIADFALPGLDDLANEDPIWSISVVSRRDALYSESNKTTADWHIRSAEYLHDIGAFVESFSPSNFARSAAESSGDDRLLARAFSCHVRSEISTGAAKAAATHIQQLEALAARNPDPYIHATFAYLQALLVLYADTSEIDSLHRPIVLCKQAVALFEECGEIDLALLARIEGANAVARTGGYIACIKEMEQALAIASRHSAWRHAGRLLLMASSAAADQGYRLRVEETTRKSIQWCQFVGDFWGRVSGIFALGRLISYTIPSRVPSSREVPERYLRQALEEADLHGAVILSAQIEAWIAWLYDKCGIDPNNLGPNTESEDERQGRRDDLVSQNASVAKTREVRMSARLQDGIEDSPDGFFVFDSRRNEFGKTADFLNEYRNGVGAKMLGIGPGTVVMFSEVQSRPLLQDLAAGMLNAAVERTPHEDVRETWSGDQKKWYRRRIIPSGDGVVLTIREVTAEREIEDALRHAAELSQQAVRIRSEFLANMSHEIRTPINGVLGLARLLADAPLDARNRSYVEDIIGSGDILLRVIGNILDLSKIEANCFEIDLQPVDLAEIITSSVRLCQGQAKEKGLKLSCTIDAEIPSPVKADGTRIRQVLTNLIGNAIKYTHSGSIEVTANLENPQLVIEVKDTGMGIPKDRLDAIFDRFQQGTRESKMLGGTGLGLALARGIVELMGGTLSATSDLGLGSLFVVRLPILVADRLPEGNDSVSVPVYLGKKALLVEDNRINTIVSENALRRLGCEVVLASDGSQALGELAISDFDVIFMDIRMPVMDGLEATKEIRKREQGKNRHTPIIALTAGAMVEEREECFRAGMDEYITKPFSDEALREALIRWIR